MDRHFLEFWGNYMLNAAKSQKQVEEVAEWVRKGFSGFDDLTSLFKKVYGLDYGLDKSSEKTRDSLDPWKKAQEDFKKSLKDYMSLLGVVPTDEHLELVKKYEQLKEKVASQEETIKHLRMMLSEAHGINSAEVTQHFDALIKKQSDQFQSLVDGFNKMFKKESPPEGGE